MASDEATKQRMKKAKEEKPEELEVDSPNFSAPQIQPTGPCVGVWIGRHRIGSLFVATDGMLHPEGNLASILMQPPEVLLEFLMEQSGVTLHFKPEPPPEMQPQSMGDGPDGVQDVDEEGGNDPSNQAQEDDPASAGEEEVEEEGENRGPPKKGKAMPGYRRKSVDEPHKFDEAVEAASHQFFGGRQPTRHTENHDVPYLGFYPYQGGVRHSIVWDHDQDREIPEGDHAVRHAMIADHFREHGHEPHSVDGFPSMTVVTFARPKTAEELGKAMPGYRAKSQPIYHQGVVRRGDQGITVHYPTEDGGSIAEQMAVPDYNAGMQRGHAVHRRALSEGLDEEEAGRLRDHVAHHNMMAAHHLTQQMLGNGDRSHLYNFHFDEALDAEADLAKAATYVSEKSYDNQAGNRRNDRPDNHPQHDDAKREIHAHAHHAKRKQQIKDHQEKLAQHRLQQKIQAQRQEEHQQRQSEQIAKEIGASKGGGEEKALPDWMNQPGAVPKYGVGDRVRLISGHEMTVHSVHAGTDGDPHQYSLRGDDGQVHTAEGHQGPWRFSEHNLRPSGERPKSLLPDFRTRRKLLPELEKAFGVLSCKSLDNDFHAMGRALEEDVDANERTHGPFTDALEERHGTEHPWVSYAKRSPYHARSVYVALTRPDVHKDGDAVVAHYGTKQERIGQVISVTEHGGPVTVRHFIGNTGPHGHCIDEQYFPDQLTHHAESYLRDHQAGIRSGKALSTFGNVEGLMKPPEFMGPQPKKKECKSRTGKDGVPLSPGQDVELDTGAVVRVRSRPQQESEGRSVRVGGGSGGGGNWSENTEHVVRQHKSIHDDYHATGRALAEGDDSAHLPHVDAMSDHPDYGPDHPLVNYARQSPAHARSAYAHATRPDKIQVGDLVAVRHGPNENIQHYEATVRPFSEDPGFRTTVRVELNDGWNEYPYRSAVQHHATHYLNTLAQKSLPPILSIKGKVEDDDRNWQEQTRQAGVRVRMPLGETGTTTGRPYIPYDDMRIVDRDNHDVPVAHYAHDLLPYIEGADEKAVRHDILTPAINAGNGYEADYIEEHGSTAPYEPGVRAQDRAADHVRAGFGYPHIGTPDDYDDYIDTHNERERIMTVGTRRPKTKGLNEEREQLLKIAGGGGKDAALSYHAYVDHLDDYGHEDAQHHAAAQALRGFVGNSSTHASLAASHLSGGFVPGDHFTYEIPGSGEDAVLGIVSHVHKDPKYTYPISANIHYSSGNVGRGSFHPSQITKITHPQIDNHLAQQKKKYYSHHRGSIKGVYGTKGLNEERQQLLKAAGEGDATAFHIYRDHVLEHGHADPQHVADVDALGEYVGHGKGSDSRVRSAHAHLNGAPVAPGHHVVFPSYRVYGTQQQGVPTHIEGTVTPTDIFGEPFWKREGTSDGKPISRIRIDWKHPAGPTHTTWVDEHEIQHAATHYLAQRKKD